MPRNNTSSKSYKVKSLSTHQKNRIEKIQQTITKLSQEATKNKLIIVEGKKDSQALKELGVNGKILTLKTGGKSFIDTIQKIESTGIPEVILLLDFDRRGKEATNKLKQHLEHQKIKVNLKFWVELKAFLNRDIQCIEGLPTYMSTIQQKVNNQTS